MDRLHPVAHPVHELVQKRWSPRAFADRLVEPDKLNSLLEAARWAPSSSNEQPWSYLVATKDQPEEFARMLACLVEGNQIWAKHAPVLMISVARRTFARNGKPNEHARHDVGQAAAWLTMQAMALGLYVHQMAGFDAAAARATYSIPEDHEPVTAIAIGYLGDPRSLPEKLRERELAQGTRKAQREFVFAGNWGEARVGTQ